VIVQRARWPLLFRARASTHSCVQRQREIDAVQQDITLCSDEFQESTVAASIAQLGERRGALQGSHLFSIGITRARDHTVPRLSAAAFSTASVLRTSGRRCRIVAGKCRPAAPPHRAARAARTSERSTRSLGECPSSTCNALLRTATCRYCAAAGNPERIEPPRRALATAAAARGDSSFATRSVGCRDRRGRRHHREHEAREPEQRRDSGTPKHRDSGALETSRLGRARAL